VKLHTLGSTLPGAAATFGLEVSTTILNDERGVGIDLLNWGAIVKKLSILIGETDQQMRKCDCQIEKMSEDKSSRLRSTS
jgi:hypothetical protein